MRILTSSDLGRRTLFASLPSQDVLDHVATVLVPESLLSPQERARAEGLTGLGQRRDFVAARALTRLLLNEWHGLGAKLAGVAEYVLEQSCDTCGGPHGRPVEVLGVGVSWAHSRGFVAAAVGPGPVGVDVEALDPARVDGPVDAKALRAWVRGEALVKRGHGSLDDSLTWRLLLEGPPSPWGQRYVVDSAGHPRRRQWSLPRARDLVITDAPTTVEGAVCSVAAGHAALWVNPIV